MVNIIVSIPEDLYDKMKKYSEVEWSEVVRKALDFYAKVRELEWKRLSTTQVHS
jgi:metal-responsive CopG/Arc/MetJ family transcriptional regulator